MTLSDQLHQSATHAAGSDPACPKCGEGTKIYANVAMYRSGMFGIARTDCKTVEVTTGVKYAQYNNAIRVKYLEKGKRITRGFILDYDPWLRLIALADAVPEPDGMVRNGNGSLISRYASHDPRYTTDFEDSIAGVPVALVIGAGAREGAHLEQCEEARQ